MSSKTLWSWGRANYGQLGLGDIVRRSSPEQVGSLTNWDFLTTGGTTDTLVIKTDGTLWGWGANSYGQLGLEDNVHRSSPEQVGSLTDWSLIYGGGDHVLAIKTDGTLWAWGYNNFGELGLKDSVNRSSPVQVGVGTSWAAVAAGESYHTVALKTDGTLWAWGANNYGQLGLGDIAGDTNRSSPEQVGALTNWSFVGCGYHQTLAIKTDGTLWGWGNNDYGQLGIEDIAHRSSPEQIGALTNWSYAVSGYYHTLALKTDGTLWSWGRNDYGQLGIEDVAHRSSPEQVGTLTNWSSVFTGLYHTASLRTDGTLWSWGRDNYSQLGLGTASGDLSSPGQVGSLTNWSSVGGGWYFTLGIRGPVEIEDVVIAWIEAGESSSSSSSESSSSSSSSESSSSSSSSESSSSSSSSESSSSSSSSESSSSSSSSESSSSSSCVIDATTVYTKGDYAALPGDSTDLETVFTCPEYVYVELEDTDYVEQCAAGEYLLFLLKNKHTNNTDTINISCKGQSNIALSEAGLYLQIYNTTTSGWETVDSDTTTGADTPTTLSGTVTTGVSNYYAVDNWVSCRIYQEAI